MRLIHLAAGAGNMNCGACARDVHMLRGLIQRGHDVQVIPLYTPLRIEGEGLPTDRVFLGGLNAWLQQQSGFFRALPPALDRLLDSPGLLRFIARYAISTDASSLGPMTVSVLAGRNGRQRKEFTRLLEHLRRQPPPDAFVITNLLLAGFAPELKREFGRPIICQLQGEDSFIDATGEPHRSRAWDLMREAAASVDRFVAPCADYAERMTGLLGIPAHQAHTIRTGLSLDAYRPAAREMPEVFTIAYLSSILPAKGLDILLDAFGALLAQGRQVRLRIAGAVMAQGYWRALQTRLMRPALAPHVEVLGEVDLPGKIALLRSCSVFCQPSRIYEVRGLTVLEALAAGAPVVAPRRGVSPEMLALTGGGLLVPPEDPVALAAALARLQDEPGLAASLTAGTAEALASHHGPAATIDPWEALLQECLDA